MNIECLKVEYKKEPIPDGAYKPAELDKAMIRLRALGEDGWQLCGQLHGHFIFSRSVLFARDKNEENA